MRVPGNGTGPTVGQRTGAAREDRPRVSNQSPLAALRRPDEPTRAAVSATRPGDLPTIADAGEAAVLTATTGALVEANPGLAQRAQANNDPRAVDRLIA